MSNEIELAELKAKARYFTALNLLQSEYTNVETFESARRRAYKHGFSFETQLLESRSGFRVLLFHKGGYGRALSSDSAFSVQEAFSHLLGLPSAFGLYE